MPRGVPCREDEGGGVVSSAEEEEGSGEASGVRGFMETRIEAASRS